MDWCPAALLDLTAASLQHAAVLHGHRSALAAVTAAVAAAHGPFHDRREVP